MEDEETGNDEDTFEEETDENKKNAVYRRVWNRVTQHIFLVILVVVHTLGGAIVFRLLERPTDVSQREELVDDIEWTISKLYELSYDEGITKEKWSQELIARMETLSPKMCNKKIWNDVRERKAISHWTNLNTISAFCFSLITATPTGHIQPSTYNGKLFFVVYCVIGIPLCLTTLRELGIRTTEALQIIIMHLQYKCYGIRSGNRSVKPGTSLATKWKRLNHKIALATIAHGSRPLPGKSKKVYVKVEPSPPLPKKWQDVNVPSFLVIAMWLCYLFMLAICFSLLEGWLYLESLYFVIMTLITCPMGDFIPRETPLALYSMFIATGLLLFSLCFNVCYSRLIEGTGNMLMFTWFENRNEEEAPSKAKMEKSEK